MYLDLELKLEALSSLFGQIINPYGKKEPYAVAHAANILSVGKFFVSTLIGKPSPYVQEFFINAEEFFDKQYDFDFSELPEETPCVRGGEPYERPKGWYRMGLKVRGKYPDGDTWLGPNGWRSNSAEGEWPVSFHGTSLDRANAIIKSHYKAGSGELYGRGIYSTPDIHVAEKEDYAKSFTSKKTGKHYKVILQNRISPQKRKICQRPDYWLIPVAEGTSADEEKRIVESSLRPYGVLIKEM
ncbi:uncharacterized protein [Brachyistius frenatus]|uniref:uncharacterized protein n=1 Tax=Brachyistius frenatus TaxID=100188 RepID=UPI0037E82A99